MPSVAELGKRAKAKWPGSYDDISDEELGLKVQKKFPGAYDDFSPAGPVAPPIAKGLSGPQAGILERAAENAPASALNVVRGAFPPTAIYDQLKAGAPKTPREGLDRLVETGKGVVRPFLHPQESFADDPVGTGVAWAGAVTGLKGGIKKAPAMGRAAESAVAKTARAVEKLPRPKTIAKAAAKVADKLESRAAYRDVVGLGKPIEPPSARPIDVPGKKPPALPVEEFEREAAPPLAEEFPTPAVEPEPPVARSGVAWRNFPEPVAAPVPEGTPIPGELPSGRKPGSIANQVDRPIPAPFVEAAGPSPAALDQAAQALGAKNWKMVESSGNGPQIAAVRRLAERLEGPAPNNTLNGTSGTSKPPQVASSSPDGAPPSSGIDTTGTVPAPSGPVGPVSAPSTEPVVSSEVAKPIPAPLVQDSPAVELVADEPVPAPFKHNALARELQAKGLKSDDLLKPGAAAEHNIPEDMHPAVVNEMRSLESRGIMDAQRGNKDAALTRFFRANGITPEAIEGMSDEVLATHIKNAGFRIPGKSGALGRSSAKLKHDLANAMRAAEVPSGEPLVSPSAKPADIISTENKGGVQGIVRTPKGTKAKYRWRIDEADDLVTSFEEGGDANLQNRDTTRKASMQRIAKREGDMDPAAMGASYLAGDGAPITKGLKNVTRNHGTKALKNLYARNDAKIPGYRAMVEENAGLAGMSPEAVAKMKKPVLHRELLEDWTPEQTRDFVVEANQSSTARMATAELAQHMAEKLKGSVMDAFDVSEDGVPSVNFIRGLIADLPVEEQAAFFTKDGKGVSQDGARMARNAVFAKAFPDTAAIESMAESTDSNIRNITNAMLKAAPDLAQVNEGIARGDLHPLSVTDDVGAAVEVVENLRKTKTNVSDWLNQNQLGGPPSPELQMLVDVFTEAKHRPSIIRDTLKNYAAAVQELGNPKQPGMFGAKEIPSRLKLLEDSYAEARRASDAAAKKAAAAKAAKNPQQSLEEQ